MRVTIRDVAREAGVSVATVSYVMNDRQDVKIKKETRKKVLQIANLLNYTPNSIAKSLATGRYNTIGITYKLDGLEPSRNLQVSYFVNLLIERLHRMKYDILFLPVDPADDNIQVNQKIDGIIAIDLSSAQFKKFSDHYLVPIIVVDMMLDDNLFYQVYTNLSGAITNHLKQHRTTTIVLSPFANESYMKSVTSLVKPSRLYTITNSARDDLRSLKGKKLLVLGAYLAIMISPYVDDNDITVIAPSTYKQMLPPSVKLLEYDVNKKANITINLLLNAIDHIFDVKHTYEIDIDN